MFRNFVVVKTTGPDTPVVVAKNLKIEKLFWIALIQRFTTWGPEDKQDYEIINDA